MRGSPLLNCPRKRRNSVAEDAHKPAPGQDVENTIEDLTKELSRLINEAGADGREELRDYAVSLLQGETETTQTEEPVRKIRLSLLLLLAQLL